MARGAVQRPAVVPGRRRGAQLHARRGQARDRAVHAQPHHQAAGDADGHPAADPHDAERRADRGRRAPAPVAGAAHGRDRGRDRGADGVSRQACRHGADHAVGSRAEQRRLAEAATGACRLSGHQARAEHRQRLSQHRRGGVRRRHPPRRKRREGHDRRPDRPGLAPGGGRVARHTSQTHPAPAHPRGSGRAQLHQPPARQGAAGSTPGSSRRMGRSCASGSMAS